MKRAWLFGLMMLGLAVWSAPLSFAETADDVPAQKVKKGKKKDKKSKKDEEAAAVEEAEPAELSPVAAGLKKVKCYTKSTPALDAKYYIFLFSTSNCTHCNRTMPDDVIYYQEMRRQGDVEMILVTMSQLDNPTAAKGFLDKYGAPFAGMVWEDMKAAGVPGSNGFQLPPGFVIVRNDGQVVHSGPGSVNGRNMMQDWKQHTIGEDAVIPPPSPAELKAKKEAEKAKAKAEKEKAKADKKAKKKKK